MSTFGNLIDDVKQACRETTTEKDAFLLSAAIRLYRQYLRSDDWPQARTVGTPLAIVTGTQAYDLPADFDRFASDRVNYNWTTGTPSYPAFPLPVVYRNNIDGARVISTWEAVNQAANIGCLWPSVVEVQFGGANTYQLMVYPLAGTTGDTIAFDYFALPARTAITTGTTITVDPLYETMVAALSAEYATYIQDQTGFAMNSQMAARAHRNARVTLSSL